LGCGSDAPVRSSPRVTQTRDAPGRRPAGRSAASEVDCLSCLASWRRRLKHGTYVLPQTCVQPPVKQIVKPLRSLPSLRLLQAVRM
jgi:hypothetical protein